MREVITFKKSFIDNFVYSKSFAEALIKLNQYLNTQKK